MGEQTFPPHIPTAYFDLIVDPIAGINPIFALGKYRISAIENNNEVACFFMDWRTSDYGACPDVQFIYDYSSKHFRDEANTQTIDGTTQNIWDLVGGIDHITSGLELYLTVTNQSSHPYLQWNSYHTTPLGYYVHRTVTTTSGTITSTILTTNCYYLDSDFEITNPRYANDAVEYYVTAKISSTEESLNGNVVTAVGNNYTQWKSIGYKNENEKVYSFNLNQNYPNPFNPTTTIRYELAESGFVNLKVYKINGEVVSELINREQNKGNYDINFNAKDLPSGIYFYKLQTEKYTDVKKMILVK